MSNEWESPFNATTAESACAILGNLFFREPEWALDEAKRKRFERMYVEAVATGIVDYTDDAPKSEFLHYLVSHQDVLLHGSNRSDITELTPLRQTDWAGTPVTAVFATGDSVWPMFFAVLRREGFEGSMRNGALVVDDGTPRGKRFYFFSINQAMLKRKPWTSGTIYILPKHTFKPASEGLVRFDEWMSYEAVRPVARLAIQPEDFPFLHRVTGHDESESVHTSWTKFKSRQSHNL